MSEPWPAGEGHDRAIFRECHRELEQNLTSGDLVSLDKGFWGVEGYTLSPPRTYQLYLPPNPSTKKWEKLTPTQKQQAEYLSALNKAMHMAGIERMNGRLKAWASLDNKSLWRHGSSLLAKTFRFVAAILNTNSKVRAGEDSDTDD